VNLISTLLVFRFRQFSGSVSFWDFRIIGMDPVSSVGDPG